MPDFDGTTFTVEELDTADGTPPLSLTLRGRNAPIGGLGSGGAFEDTDETRQAEFYYPGADEPTRHVMGSKHRPLQIHGTLQDRFNGGPGTAKPIKDALKSIASRKRRVRLSWADESWLALSDLLTISPETTGVFNYEWSFHIDRPDGMVTPFAATAPTAPEDVASTIAGGVPRLAAVTEELDTSLMAAATAAAVYEAILATLAASQAFNDVVAVLVGAQDLSDSDLGQVLSLGATLVTSSTRTARLLGCVDLYEGASWQAAAAWQRARADAIEASHELVAEAMRTQERLLAMRSSGVPEEVYYTTDGDTLEGIARVRMGDAGRAGDIARRNGLSSFRVTAGTRLVLPARG